MIKQQQKKNNKKKKKINKAIHPEFWWLDSPCVDIRLQTLRYEAWAWTSITSIFTLF